MKINFQINLSIEECKSIINNNIGKIKYRIGGGYKGNKTFIGELNNNSFKIQIALKYMNSFAPIFYGNFRGCQIFCVNSLLSNF